MAWLWTGALLLFLAAESLMTEASLHLYAVHHDGMTRWFMIATLLFPVLTLVTAIRKRTRINVQVLTIASLVVLMFAIGLSIH